MGDKQKLLVANRGEIAIRIMRAAADIGMNSIAVYPADDEKSLHTQKADEAYLLPGQGVAAYLDISAVIEAAKASGATMIHPGYGFLSESAELATACRQNNIIFVGPEADTIALFGNKHLARELAEKSSLPLAAGTTAPTSLEDAKRFMDGLPDGAGAMVKAVAGGGGRGIRAVRRASDLPEAYTRASSEAQNSFGNGDLYLERFIDKARHIEVQIIGDGKTVIHLWERDCTLQRRHQKLVEIAPAPALPAPLRGQILDAAIRLGEAVQYKNLGTVEFLVDVHRQEFFFIEVNPRLQVEHTVTEEITGLSLVELQLKIAGGATLSDLGLSADQLTAPRGIAVQLRINMESLADNGDTIPGGGTLSSFQMPSGQGVRVDSYGYQGYKTSPAYDSLLAKLIVHSGTGDMVNVTRKANRALRECDIKGVPTNISFLSAILSHDRLGDYTIDTGFIADEMPNLIDMAKSDRPAFYFEDKEIAVKPFEQRDQAVPKGAIGARSPFHGILVEVSAPVGTAVKKGAQLAVVEAMKMEHVVLADQAGTVGEIFAEAGDQLHEGQIVIALIPSSSVDGMAQESEAGEQDPDHIRPDLEEILARREQAKDENRPKAVEKRRRRGQRTARENLADLLDKNSFVEYGSQVLPAQRRRKSTEELIEVAPADGVITGLGSVNAGSFDDPHNRVAVMSYDTTVFAGTQGVHNHWKTDRLIDIAEQARLPFILFAEGGGGRPHDDDYIGFPSIDSFHHFSKLSALVPIIGVVSGRCFAGNAALLGGCDVIIATKNSNLGMGGPAMIEGGGLGVFTPDEIGPSDIQYTNGVIDILVEDEAEAVAATKQYLSYFQGTLKDWTAPDQRKMRSIVPENRLRAYEIRDVINTLADEGSVLELRAGFAKNLVTALIRVEGRPVGVLANDPKHLGGAIDSDASDKGARFMSICDAFDIAVLNLCDTPGFMVGPEIEKTGLVRHSARMFLAGANLSVPCFTVMIRKAYGLGAIGMAAGDYKVPLFTISWPTGEIGAMGLEGQVKLGFKRELEAVEDPVERQKLYERLVSKLYEQGKALEQASYHAIDETIDPAETRFWLANLLSSIKPKPRDGKKRPMIDAW